MFKNYTEHSDTRYPVFTQPQFVYRVLKFSYLAVLFAGCDENDIRPSILKMNVQPSKQSDFSYRVTLEWIVEYNIDVLESLDFFRIIVSTESLLRNNSFFEENNIPAHDTVCCITISMLLLTSFCLECCY